LRRQRSPWPGSRPCPLRPRRSRSIIRVGVFGSPNLSETVRIEGPGRAATTVRAGPFRMTDGIDDFVLWCFDIAQICRQRDHLSRVSDPLGSERASLLNRLFTSHYGGIDTTTEGAAFQVAVWEIVYENLAGPLSLGGGVFKHGQHPPSPTLPMAGFRTSAPRKTTGSAISNPAPTRTC
jgi:hypothetical protein